MIRINLLKQSVKKKEKRKSTVSPLLIKFCTGGVILLLTGGGVWYGLNHIPHKVPAEKTEVAAKEDYTPSSREGARVVEEVVRDRDDSRDELNSRGLLALPYEQFGPVEKVNYEIHFAKKICDLLRKTAAPGIDLTWIELKEYTQLRGTGISGSKQMVVDFFKALKVAKADILPKPQSQIVTAKEGFAFTVNCTIGFGLDLSDPFLLSEADFPLVEDIEVLVKRAVEIASDNRIHFTSRPKRREVTMRGNYRQLPYGFAGTAAYSDFVLFVENLYKRQVPCAFRQVSLKAITKNTVTIDAEIVFTARSR